MKSNDNEASRCCQGVRPGFRVICKFGNKSVSGPALNTGFLDESNVDLEIARDFPS